MSFNSGSRTSQAPHQRHRVNLLYFVPVNFPEQICEAAAACAITSGNFTGSVRRLSSHSHKPSSLSHTSGRTSPAPHQRHRVTDRCRHLRKYFLKCSPAALVQYRHVPPAAACAITSGNFTGSVRRLPSHSHKPSSLSHTSGRTSPAPHQRHRVSDMEQLRWWKCFPHRTPGCLQHHAL